MSREMRTVKLGDILTPEQGDKVVSFINAKDKQGLRDYLTSIKDDLDGHEVVPNYLYYMLEYQFGL
jgi:hypothetical protein